MRRVGFTMLAACTFAPHAAGAPTADDASRADATASDGKLVDTGSSDAAGDGAPSLATVSFVQGQSAVGTDTSALAVVFDNPVATHDLSLIGLTWDKDDVTITSVTDRDGNGFTQVGTALVVANVGALAVYIAPDTHSGVLGDQITVTFSDAVNPVAIIGEYSGLSLGNPVDGTNAQTSTSKSLDSGNFTTAHPHDLVIGFGASFENVSAGNGFTERFHGIDMLEDEELLAPSTAHATGSTMFTDRWLIRGVALKAAD